MNKPFIYGAAVGGENFTDRVQETRRLRMDFENGLNAILISPRRMGKTSLVQKVRNEMTDEKIKVIYMDIYDCRSEYDFLERFASILIKQTESGDVGRYSDGVPRKSCSQSLFQPRTQL